MATTQDSGIMSNHPLFNNNKNNNPNNNSNNNNNRKRIKTTRKSKKKTKLRRFSKRVRANRKVSLKNGVLVLWKSWTHK